MTMAMVLDIHGIMFWEIFRNTPQRQNQDGLHYLQWLTSV